MKLQNGSKIYGKLAESIHSLILKHNDFNIINQFIDRDYDWFVLNCCNQILNANVDSIAIVTTCTPINWCFHLSKMFDIKLIGYHPLLQNVSHHFTELDNVTFYNRNVLTDRMDDIICTNDFVLFPDYESYIPLDICKINLKDHFVGACHNMPRSPNDYVIPWIKDKQAFDQTTLRIKTEFTCETDKWKFKYGKFLNP